jgi:hypothetical protein
MTVDEPRWLGIEARHLATLRAVADAAVAVFADLAEHSAAERRLRTVREA